ncbi:MAG: succinyl-CoA synthetase beta subunit, partial [Verrucomicrobiales bacterium]
MNIHEYQAKQLFKAAGIKVAEGTLATTVDEVVAAYEAFGGVCAVKAQVHVGGRGKAGGVKIVKNVDDARAAAEAILGMDIKGHTVHKVYVEQG